MSLPSTVRRGGSSGRDDDDDERVNTVNPSSPPPPVRCGTEERSHRYPNKYQRFRGVSVSVSTTTTLLFVTLLLVTTMTMIVTGVTAFEPPSVFPVSVRQALAEKAKAINPPGDYKYGRAGWSNRAATVLTPVYLGGATETAGSNKNSNSNSNSNSHNVYTADRPFYWNNIDVSCRMCVIELPPHASAPASAPGGASSSSSSKDEDAGPPPLTSSSSSLWIHSPVTADGPMKQVIANLPGHPVVEHVVSTNYEHLKFAPEWAAPDAYPNANFWACPGLPARMPDMPWKGEIPDGYRPAGWKGAAVESPLLPTGEPWWDRTLIQPLHVNIEVNPATGRPFFNEVIYFHTVSKTLMVTDLFFNYPASTVPNSEFGRNDAWELAPVVSNIPVGSRVWKKGMDWVYAPFFSNLMVTDRAAFRDIAEHIVNVWQPEIVIPAHGDILRGKDFIRQVLSKKLGLSN